MYDNTYIKHGRMAALIPNNSDLVRAAFPFIYQCVYYDPIEHVITAYRGTGKYCSCFGAEYALDEFGNRYQLPPF